jgi:hypothetical protein
MLKGSMGGPLRAVKGCFTSHRHRADHAAANQPTSSGAAAAERGVHLDPWAACSPHPAERRISAPPPSAAVASSAAPAALTELNIEKSGLLRAPPAPIVAPMSMGYCRRSPTASPVGMADRNDDAESLWDLHTTLDLAAEQTATHSRTPSNTTNLTSITGE